MAKQTGLYVHTLFLFLIGCLASLVHGLCECGYATDINLSDGVTNAFVFTDLLETDFVRGISNIRSDTDWLVQEYNVSGAVDRGQYGMIYELDNVIENAVDANNDTGILGGAPGLRLQVSPVMDAYVPVSQIDSSRQDLFYGSYRASLWLTGTAGTCSAWYWYKNDSQEIDMEFLSSQFDFENKTFPVNLVMQTALSAKIGYNTLGDGTYFVVNLPFDPTDGFHEYRFDFVPGNVIFYADSIRLGSMNTSVPSTPGHLMLTQWSNGNPGWTSGPPTQNATITAAYVKAYFNSSAANRQTDAQKRCSDPSASGAVCAIPDQNLQLSASQNYSSFFFMYEGNSTNNQTIYKKNGGMTEKFTLGRSAVLIILLTALNIILL